MTKMTWNEMKDEMIRFNDEHGIHTKGSSNDTLTGVAVISADSFDKEWSLESRSYVFTNHNKAFLPSNVGYSIFASALDGSDNGVRLEWYVEGANPPWKVDYCYIKE